MSRNPLTTPCGGEIYKRDIKCAYSARVLLIWAGLKPGKWSHKVYRAAHWARHTTGQGPCLTSGIKISCTVWLYEAHLPMHITGKSLANSLDGHTFLLSFIIILLITSTNNKVFPGYKLTTCWVTKMLAQNFKHIPLLSYVSNFMLRNNVTWVIISFEFTVWRIRAQKYPQVQQLPCFPLKEKNKKRRMFCLFAFFMR